MESESESCDLLPPYQDLRKVSTEDVLGPDILVLAGQTVLSETVASTPLYQMNRSVTSIPQTGSSVIFERVEPAKSRNLHLFYLAHPENARYRKDTPAYYITSVSESIGNIQFETSKPRLQKTEFSALLSAKRTASDKPLFDEKSQRILFKAKAKWKVGHYRWSDSDDTQIAFEETKSDQKKLVITAPMQRDIRDALAALWVLRLWHDTAESSQARREALDDLTPPSAFLDMKLSKRTGALGAFAGAGAGC